MNKIKSCFKKMMNVVNGVSNNQRGSQTLEWIGIAAVIIIVVGLVSTAFQGSDFGDKVVQKIGTFLSKIGGGE